MFFRHMTHTTLMDVANQVTSHINSASIYVFTCKIPETLI